MTEGQGWYPAGMPDTTPPLRQSNQVVAEKCGLSATMVSRLRNGHRIPSFDTMRKVIKAYDLDKGTSERWFWSITTAGAEGSSSFLRRLWG